MILENSLAETFCCRSKIIRSRRIQTLNFRVEDFWPRITIEKEHLECARKVSFSNVNNVNILNAIALLAPKLVMAAA